MGTEEHTAIPFPAPRRLAASAVFGTGAAWAIPVAAATETVPVVSIVSAVVSDGELVREAAPA